MDTMTKFRDITGALELFEDSAIKHTEATLKGDFKTANKSYAIIEKVIKYLKEKDEMIALLGLLNHISPGVRCWAATYLLPIKEKEAIIVLVELGKRADILALDAKTVLSEWRKGDLKG